MAIKGQTINVALDPRGYKELNKLENLVPTHLDLRNGHYTDAKRWEKRFGYKGVVVLAEQPEETRTPSEEEEPGGETPPEEICVPPGQDIVQVDTLGPAAIIPAAQALDWSYVEPNGAGGEIIKLAWVNYFESPPIKFYTLTDGVVTSEVAYTTQVGEFLTWMLIGHSERPVFHSASGIGNLRVLILPEEGNQYIRLITEHMTPPMGLGAFIETGTFEMFTSHGDNFIIGLTTALANYSGEYLIRFPMLDMSDATAFALWPDPGPGSTRSLASLHDNGNYLYALGGLLDPCVIFQYDRITLDLLDTINLPAGKVFKSLFVEDDNMIWLLEETGVSTFGLGYWRNSTFTYIDDSILRTGGNEGQLFITKYPDGSRYWYMGYHQTGGIGKFGPILCP